MYSSFDLEEVAISNNVELNVVEAIHNTSENSVEFSRKLSEFLIDGCLDLDSLLSFL